jgi:hypothetical protein
MGMACHSTWWSLVLAYQLTVRISCDGRTAVMFGEAAMAEPWDGVGTTVMAGTHKAQEGLLGGSHAHTGGETSVGMLQGR